MRATADILEIAAEVARGEASPPEGTFQRRDVGRVLEGAPEAWLSRLDQVLTGAHAREALCWLEATGALGVLLPEVQALVGFHEGVTAHHKDLWAHTIEVVERTPVEADLRWVALLHDIGKIATRAIDERGRVTFYGHERLGAWLVGGVAARLGMPRARATRIAFVVEHHARVNAYAPDWTDRAVRRLIRDAGEHLEDMLQFSGADYTTRRRGRASRIQAHLAELTERIAEIRRQEASPEPLPSGLGRALCEGLSLRPGPQIGDAIRWLEAEINAGRLPAGAVPEVYVTALQAREAT